MLRQWLWLVGTAEAKFASAVVVSSLTHTDVLATCHGGIVGKKKAKRYRPSPVWKCPEF